MKEIITYVMLTMSGTYTMPADMQVERGDYVEIKIVDGQGVVLAEHRFRNIELGDTPTGWEE